MNELQSLSQIFQNKLFRIPDYQRGYAWQDPQLRDFWEDLINLQADRYHYTGLLSLKLLSKQEEKKLGNDDQWLLNSGYNVYHIVDGQQRLTTAVILLNEIITFVRASSDNANKAEESIYIGYENLKDIRNKYICRTMPPADLVTTYMFGYENDNPSAEYLKYKVFGQKFGGTIKETYYTKNLKYAKSFFAREIEAYYNQYGMNGLAELYQKITLISFVHEEREIPDEITEEEYESEDSSEEYKSRHELRKAYWEIALPYIKEANKNADGTGPFAKVSAGKNNYIDGFFGMQIIHLYCKVNQQPQLCSAGLWIDCGDETRNKKAFDFLYAHREEIEAHVSMPIVWNRKDEHRACSIDVVLPDSNIWNKNDLPRMAQFQAKTTKELADYVVRAYEQTLKDM